MAAITKIYSPNNVTGWPRPCYTQFMKYINITGDISHDTLREFLEQIQVLKGPVQIEICSGGGDMQPAFAIADIIKARGKVTTVASGLVGSAAVPIFCSGHKRFIRPTATLYLHPPTMSLKGVTSPQMTAEALQFERDCGLYTRLIASHCGIKDTVVQSWIKTDHYFSADEVIKLRLAHAIKETL